MNAGHDVETKDAENQDAGHSEAEHPDVEHPDVGHADAEYLCPGAPESALRHRFTPRRMMLGFCKVAVGVVFLAVVGAGILALRLQAGPIEIEGLGQKIAAALHGRFGEGVNFDVGRTSMRQRGFGPTLAIDTLVVTGPDHQTILTAPKAEVSVDPFALLFGKVVPRRLEVLDVTLRLVLLRNGALAVAAGEGTKPFAQIGAQGDGDPHNAPEPVDTQSSESPQPADPAAPEGAPASHRAIATKQAAAAIRQFLDILTDPHGAVAAVDRLGITRGKLVIEDQMTNEEVVYSDLDLAFDKGRRSTSLTLSAMGPSGRWTVTAQAQGAPGRDRAFGVKAENLSIDEMQLILGTRSLGFDSDMPIAMSASIGVRADDTLSEAVGGYKLGPGFLRPEDPDQEPIFVNEIAGGLHWDGTDRRIVIEPVRYVEATGTHLSVAGSLEPPRDEGDPWRIALATTEPFLLAPDRKGQPPFVMDAGSFKGRLFSARKTFMIDALSFHGKDGGIAMAGAVDWVHGPHVKLGARIDPTSVQAVQRVWPSSMAASVRGWLTDHFEDGYVTSGTIQVDYDAVALKRMRADRAPPDKSVSLDFTLTKGRLRYLDGVPPIENVAGVGHITGRTSRFTLTSGTINVDGRQVNVSDGSFFVPNTNQHPTPATLSAHLRGPVEAITGILSRDALKPYASLPIDGSTLHGDIDGTLNKTLMLGTQGQQPDEPLRVDAKVSNFVADHLVGQESLQNANLSISVDDKGLKASGDGHIFGGPATFEITRAGEGPPVAQIALTLDEAARARLGLGVVPGVAGPMTAHVNATLGDASAMKAQVDLDLAKTSIAAAYLGLVKPAGRPAKVSFLVQSHNDRMSIDQLVIDIMSLQARGNVELGSDNGFESAHFSSFKSSPGDDMRLDVVKNDDMFKLTVRGSTIDARPYLKALTSTPVSDATPLSRSAKAEKQEVDRFKGYDIDLKTGILTGFNREVMNAVDLKLSKRGNEYRLFSGHGRFGGDAVSGSMGADHQLKIAAADAGALVSFVDLYKHMEGGSLAASMQVTEDSLAGNLEIRDFILRDEPAIRSLVARTETVSPQGQGGEARHIDATAVQFKRLKVNFHRADSRLELRDATMYGNEIGLSVDGWLDYVHDRVAMNGTFVPAFAFNNMFAQIPVFGLFLGGKSNEGLFAITFKISGSASSPSLDINPLSVITPGFLRTIFGALDAEPAAAMGESAADPAR